MQFPILTPEYKSEFDLRIRKVSLAMSADNIDALLIASSVNIFYLTGGVCRGYFYLPAEGNPLFFMLPPAKAEKDFELNIRKPEQIAGELERLGYPLPRKLGLEFSDLYYNDVERLKSALPALEYADASRVMRRARLTKTDREIEVMREDGMKHCAVYSRIGSCYREGMTDLEFQIEIERVLRREGCLGYLRVAGSAMEINMGSVIAGENADVPSPYDFTMGGAGTDPSLPVGASGIIMKPGMTVMVDMNGGFNGYQTDMTRCWSVGTPSDEALRAHECSRKILRHLERLACPGTEIGLLYTEAERIAREEGLSKYFMGHRNKVKFIGHGIGIELDEAPVIMERNKMPLEANMTLAIEPKFVLPEAGAVGVENTYVVRDNGLENLTPYDETLSDIDN